MEVQINPTPRIDSEKLLVSVPSKVFLLGEYLAREGGPSLVAAISPRFEAWGKKGGQFSFPEHSPAQKLWVESGQQGTSESRIVDPWGGAGGFGASTAQFLMAASALGLLTKGNWAQLLSLYRRCAVGRPSGADLIAQWLGGVIEFHATRAAPESVLSSEQAVLTIPEILVFSAAHLPGRKVATHVHLMEIEKNPPIHFSELLKKLESLARRGIAAFRKKDFREFGSALTDYAIQLSQSGLESEPSRQDRLAFLDLPGVAGAKGCGALLSDTVLVVLDPEARRQGHERRVFELAERRQLQIVSKKGLEIARGLEA